MIHHSHISQLYDVINMLDGEPIKVSYIKDVLRHIIADMQTHSVLIKDGLKKAASKGKFAGRPLKYDYDFVGYLLEQIEEGIAASALADHHGIPTSTIYHLLKKAKAFPEVE